MAPSAPGSDFEARVGPFRPELRAYCYRMLGSLQVASAAVDEALLGAWRGFDGFDGRASLRSWLYRFATNACVRILAQRPKRLLSFDYGPAGSGVELDPIVDEPVWLEPYPHDPAVGDELLESMELAYVAALQHLPPPQRAALVLREVLGLDAAEVAHVLYSTAAAVDGALELAKDTLAGRLPARSQQATLRALGGEAQRALIAAFADAFRRADAGALAPLLADDAKFSMPPIPTWFAGREAITRFISERVFANEWRVVPLRASGQLAFACYRGPAFRLGALNVLTLRDRSICEMTGFLDPAVHAQFRLPS